MVSAAILIVEDDESLRLALADNLEDEGYDVRTAASVAEAEARLAEGAVDLIILDVMLPDGDGYSMARALRSEGREVRILMLTARTLEDDLVQGFEAGADDYLSKPYRLRELLLRVRALLSRGTQKRVADRFGDYTLEREARRVTDGEGRPVELTRTEYDLLVLFLDNPDKALSRDRILDEVWGKDVVVDGRTVDNFVSSLKKKLRAKEASGFSIKTVRGVGYRMERA